MITKSSLLIDYPDERKIHTELVNLIGWADVNFNILRYDYFSIAEYNEYINSHDFHIDEDDRWVKLLGDVNFSYEVDFGTSTHSIESNYLPVLTDFISQLLSARLHCSIVSSFKSLSGDDCPITYFFNGKEVINFSSVKSSCWNKVRWVKSL